MSTRVSINLRSAGAIITDQGLDRNGRVQRFLTHEARRLMDPYVPKKDGELKNTAIERNDSVTYVQPYARRHYYENKGGNGLRGSQWDKRMMATRGPELIRAAMHYARSGG